MTLHPHMLITKVVPSGIDLSAWEMHSIGAFSGTVGMDPSDPPQVYHYESYEYMSYQVLTQQSLGMLEKIPSL